MVQKAIETHRYQAITRSNIQTLPLWQKLDRRFREAIETVSVVLPFRTNRYVLDELIDQRRIPDDPIFQLTLPQRGMLADDHYAEVRRLLKRGDRERLQTAVRRIRYELNPHPGGQLTHNEADLDGEPIRGAQHKYRETVLHFPAPGQTCHAYCTFCFRWAQFVGDRDLRFAAGEADQLAAYLRRHPRVTDIVFTGGDPMIMATSTFARYVEPLLGIESLMTIRIGTKAPAYWPQRFVTDDDADDLMRLMERIVGAGKHVAIMAHLSYPVELSTRVAREAIRRIRATGAEVRMQGPVLRHINDDAGAWVDLWRDGVRLGCIPYYMFVARDTGARRYFAMPLVRCWNIFRNAYQQVSGLCRTVRGPTMSCFPGKCHVLGVTEVAGQKAFCLQFIQAREPDLVRRPFFAKFDPRATWYDELEPFSRSDVPFFISPGTHDDSQTPVTIRSNN